MAIFTTNWYLYKTHVRNTSSNNQRTVRNTRKLTLNEENDLLKSLVEEIHDL